MILNIVVRLLIRDVFIEVLVKRSLIKRNVIMLQGKLLLVNILAYCNKAMDIESKPGEFDEERVF